MKLVLPEGYFVGVGFEIDKFSVFVIVICLACVLITFILWAKYGKDDQVIETVEFYPPEGFNSAEVGFLYEGTASTESIISLLIYLANKGYLQIEETEVEMLFSKSKKFKITKLKEYDGDNECEKIFFNGLFKGGAGTANIAKAREIKKEAKLHGEKISFQDALELSMKTGKTKQSVTAADLYDNFYITLDKIKSNLNSKDNKNKIFESISSGKIKWLFFMIIAIFILITIKPVLKYFETELIGFLLLPFTLAFPGIGFTVSFVLIFCKTISIEYGKSRRGLMSVVVAIFIIVICTMIPSSLILLPCLLTNMFYLITYFIGIACVATIVIFMNIMPKRTPYGNEILGKIKGFKRFLETAEKPQLESLVMKNPKYFYDILPYTYALGVSDVWISQFETIALEAPHWYDSDDYFSFHEFGTFMNSTMKSASTAMSFDSSSSSDGGSGGSSGGGSGGGGGGSW